MDGEGGVAVPSRPARGGPRRAQQRVDPERRIRGGLVFRGKILEEMGNALEAERCYEEALQCFRASLELEPENAEFLYHQALLLEDLERTDEAIDAYAASASRGHSADVLICLSALLLRLGRAADALVLAVARRPRYPFAGRGQLSCS